MFQQVRYLLLQVRNSDDPMRGQEVNCFAKALAADVSQISVFDLLGAPLQEIDIVDVDMILIGGSGHYSAAGEGRWLEVALESLRVIHDSRKPTFASCWGFQAMARAKTERAIRFLARSDCMSGSSAPISSSSMNCSG